MATYDRYRHSLKSFKKKKKNFHSKETRVTVPFISFFYESLAVLLSNNSLERSRAIL